MPRGEILVKKAGDTTWKDMFELYGVSLTVDSEDLEAKGEVVHYSYQHNNSNEVDVIVPRDSDGNIIRKATEVHLNVFMQRSDVPQGSTVQSSWDSFINYICGEPITIRLRAGATENSYICISELNPTPVYDFEDGSVKIYTCDMPLQQLNSQSKRY